MHMVGKARPFKPEAWPTVVINALSSVEEYYWVALATTIVGLPSETIEDAYATLRIIEEIEELGLRTFLVPLLFVPIGTSALRDAPSKSFTRYR